MESLLTQEDGNWKSATKQNNDVTTKKINYAMVDTSTLTCVVSIVQYADHCRIVRCLQNSIRFGCECISFYCSITAFCYDISIIFWPKTSQDNWMEFYKCKYLFAPQWMRKCVKIDRSISELFEMRLLNNEILWWYTLLN